MSEHVPMEAQGRPDWVAEVRIRWYNIGFSMHGSITNRTTGIRHPLEAAEVQRLVSAAPAGHPEVWDSVVADLIASRMTNETDG